jgi:hypothetical protein
MSMMRFMNGSRCFAMMVLVTLLAGCSSFDRDYRQAATSGSAQGIEGAWEGRWESQAGHGGGDLRAILTRTASDTCHARFRAQFWGIFEADEEVDLHLSGTSPVRASGEADLGWLKGGVYRYEATLAPGKFDATYESKHDHGVFNLARPQK